MSQQNAQSPVLGQFPLALVRIIVGWHLLYEGVTKLLDPGWSSAGFLSGSTGPLAGLFRWMASSETLLWVVDQLNIWGLTLIGLSLMLGAFTRVAAWGGVALLAMYYVAYPPLFGPVLPGATEGSYLLINKNLVEMVVLLAVAAFPAAAWGLDGLLFGRARAGKAAEPKAAKPKADKLAPSYLGPMSRRQLVTGLAGVPVLGAFVLAALKKHGWKSFEEVQLSGRGVDGLSGATVKRFRFATLSDLNGEIPKGRIGDLHFSRLILGGNLIGGWAHARDLIYVSKLVKAYHHRDKIFETFSIAESCGVDTVLTNPVMCGVINDYWRNGGKIQFISDCGGQDVLAMIQKSIDRGACACYIQGGVADRLVEEGQFDLMAQGLELIRRNGLPAGIGGHKLTTIQQSVDRGLRPDFWMKTMHKVDYWSATPQPRRDNRWEDDPLATAAYMESLEEPWIAFKILGAGAIPPQKAFKWAFDNGADFICVGMYDFQIVDDVNLAAEVFQNGIERQRPWRA